MLQRLAPQVVVDERGDGPDFGHREPRDHVFGAVLHEEGDHVALADAGRGQPVGEAIALPVHLPERYLPPLEYKHGPRRVLGGHALKQVRRSHVIPHIGVDSHLHLCQLPQLPQIRREVDALIHQLENAKCSGGAEPVLQPCVHFVAWARLPYNESSSVSTRRQHNLHSFPPPARPLRKNKPSCGVLKG